MHNYTTTQDGVIKQMQVTPFNYDIDYSDSRYSIFNDRGNILNLRLGYIIGTIGKIPLTLLDVGYGNGGFLKTCSNIIPKLYGSDTDYHYELPKNIEYINNSSYSTRVLYENATSST